MRISDWSSDVSSSDLMIRNDNGSVIGFIAEPTYGFEHVFFERVESDHARAPMFDLKTPTPIGRPFRLGSIWERVAKDSGECYFGGYKIGRESCGERGCGTV